MAIKFNDVCYHYQKNKEHALNNVSFNLDDHFFLGLIGQTGSGKSTLIQHLNALLRPSNGEVEVGEFVINSQNKKKLKFIKKLREYVGIVFQFPEYQLFQENVLKDVMFGPINFKVSKDEAKKRAIEALKIVGINESYYDKSPFELSGGEKRKVAIAGILAIKPKILVLDEPCAGLDPKSSKEMMDLFYSLYKQGTSIVMVSHDMGIILKYCSDVLVLYKGEVQGIFKPTELFYNEQVLSKALINPPEIINYVRILEKKGYKLNHSNIKDISSFIEEIKKVID